MVDEKDELETAEQSSDPSAEAGKPKKLMPLIVAGVVALAVGGGGGFFAKRYFRDAKSEKQIEEPFAEEHSEKQKKSDRKVEHGKTDEKKTAEKKVRDKSHTVGTGVAHELETFLVNLADADRRRYIRATISLAIRAEKDEEGVMNAVPRIRDAVLMLLSSKLAEELMTVEGKTILHEELREQINSAIGEQLVEAVYLINFIIQ